MKMNRMLGNVDVPVTAQIAVASGAAAFKHIVCIIPDLTALAANAGVNAPPQNSLRVRALHLVPEATFTGVVTNNLTLTLHQYRAGASVAAIAAVTVDNTVTLTAFEDYLVDPGVATPTLLPGDVVTLEAVVNGTGGSALPAMAVIVDLEGPNKNS